MKYVKHKETGVIKSIPEYLVSDYIATKEWEEESEFDNEPQQVRNSDIDNDINTAKLQSDTEIDNSND